MRPGLPGRLARLIVAGVVLLGPATIAHAQGTLYDDFSAPQLDPRKWRADQPLSGSGAGLELVRQISDGSLQLQHRVLGGQTDSTGTQASTNRLIFRTPYTAAVQFPVIVTNAAVAGCSVVTAPPADIEVRSFASFFNDRSGDVGATILISQSSAGTGLKAAGFVSGHGSFFGTVDLGSVDVGAIVTLRMSWDRVNHKVDFQKDADPTQSITYTLDDTRPPTSPFAALEVAGFVGNCADGSQPFGDMTALIGNVLVNP